MDVVIRDFVYEQQFRVEKDMSDGEPQVIDMDSTTDEDEDPEGDPEDMDHDANKKKHEPEGQVPKKQSNASVSPSGQQGNNTTAGAPTEQLAALMADISTEATAVQEDLVVIKENSVKPMVLLSQTGITPDGSAQWKTSMLNKGLGSGTVSPVRSSKRNASTSEQDSLEKASKLKAQKNLENSSLKGKEIQTQSFDSFDDSIMLQSASILGVSFGSNAQEISESIKNLKDLESSRITSSNVLNIQNDVIDDTSTVCSVEETVDLEMLNLICADIAEDLCDGGCDPLCLQTPVSRSKKVKPKRNNKKNKNCSR